MDFSSVKSSSFFHKILEILFGETDFPWTSFLNKAILSGLLFLVWWRWQKYYCPQSLGSKIAVAFGVFDRYTLLWCFLPPWCIKIFDCSVRISAKTLLTKWNSFLDISLFFIYSYWYLPLKEWHTTCKKEKNPKNTKEIPQWSFLLLLFVHKKT